MGVFALHNVTFDIWTLFILGVLGYAMKSLGFPLAPMILGVVLGDVAELKISRSLALSSDLTLFVTRPWSLFFLILAAFSLVFPWYQAARSRSRWTLFFPAFLAAALALPLFMMGGWVRTILATGLLLLAAFLL